MSATPGVAPASEPACRRVLVAEEEVPVARDLQRDLRGFGYFVPGVAETADEAIDLALRHRPDLVLMNIRLRGARDGIEAAIDLRGRMDVPVVFLSARSDPDTLQRAMAADAAGFIVKPFSAADVRTQIEFAHARHLRAAVASRRQKRTRTPRAPLLSGLVHDFNNILSVIMASTDALRERHGGEEVEQIRRASQLASILCRQMLPAAKAAGGETICELGQVLESNRHLLERAAGPLARVCIDAAEDAFVEAEESQIARVCLNLAMNSRRAMPRGGEFRIAARRMARGLVEMTVADDGCGMDAETLLHIFDPFFTDGGGSGLGLTIVRGIVDQLGGTISVESEPGAGTTFTILLPSADGQLREVPNLPRVSAGLRLLMVEDQDDLRGLLHGQMAAEGIESIAVPSAEEALDLLRAHGRVELLVTDVSLPRMSGVELAAECLRRGLCERVLMMSGYAAAPLAGLQDFRARMHFIAKPFTAGELRVRVNSILNDAC